MTNRIPWGPDSPGYPQCPTPAGHDVTVWLRGGRTEQSQVPERMGLWNHSRDFGDPENDIIAYCDHDAQDEALSLPADIAQFLMGTGPLEGVHFGDDHPTRKGKFWWRTVIRERAGQARAQDEERELLDHEAAIASITACAATTTILSYREAIEGYLRLRGLDAYLERKQ